ncbi:hypothetical protein AHF37_05210 [Paragonimus kellicotti]|nr:hypothetical protein AHF37_05210 [Paragonimus kellicotti]
MKLYLPTCVWTQLDRTLSVRLLCPQVCLDCSRFTKSGPVCFSSIRISCFSPSFFLLYLLPIHIPPLLLPDAVYIACLISVTQFEFAKQYNLDSGLILHVVNRLYSNFQ